MPGSVTCRDTFVPHAGQSSRACRGWSGVRWLPGLCAGAPVLSSVREGFESRGMPVANRAVRRGSGEEGQRCVIPSEQPQPRRRCGCRVSRCAHPLRPRHLPASSRHQAPAIKRRRQSIPPSQLPETRIFKERATHGRRDVLFGDPDRAEQERSGDKGSGVSPPAEEDEAGGAVYSQGFRRSPPSGWAEEAGDFERYCKALLCLLEGDLSW